MITNVFIHLANDLPILADLEEIPAGGDRSIRCTNVRTVDGKRPQFVHDRTSTFVFPLSIIRLIEIPQQSGDASQQTAAAATDQASPADEPLPTWDDEPEEDLLARIRSV